MEPVQDSIFISSLRAFCKAIAVIFGITLAFIPVIILISLLSTNTEVESKTTLTVMPDANGLREVKPSHSPVILHINLKGIIGNLNLTDEMIENQLIESRTGVLKNNRVKGVILYISSPGGSATDSDNIYRMLVRYKNRYKVPIYAYEDGICASGGVMISCAADKIYSSPSTIIGSVGALMGPFFNFKETMNKHGINSETITEGKNKDMMSPFRAWKPDDDASLKPLVAYYYDRFIQIVTNARPRIDRTALIEEYGANVFDPVKAEKLGYIDGIRDYSDTLTELLAAAGIDASKDYQVVQLSPKSSFLSCLVSTESWIGSLLQLFTKKETNLLPQVPQVTY